MQRFSNDTANEFTKNYQKFSKPMEEKTAQALTEARAAGFDALQKYFEYLRVQFDENATLTKEDEEQKEVMSITSEYSNLVRNVILLAEALNLNCSVYPTGKGDFMCVYISYYKL